MDNKIKIPVNVPNIIPESKNSYTFIIIITIIILIIIGVITGGVIYYYKNKKSDSAQTLVNPIKTLTVEINIDGPQSKKLTQTINDTIFSQLTINNFVKRYFNLDTFMAITDIYINGKSIKIIDGKIDPTISKIKISTFLNSIPSIIKLDITYEYNCGSDIPVCDSCTTQAPICTENGYVCLDNQKCPDRSELIDCCKTTPETPYAICDDTTKIISCKTCPDPKPKCDPFSSPVCTSTGWICSPGTKCPSDLSSFTCSNSTEKFWCRVENGKAYTGCSTCETPKITCPTDNLKLCSSICVGGKWVCKQGILNRGPKGICPSDKPYPTLPDPNLLNSDKTKYPNCNDTPDPNYNIICTPCKNRDGTDLEKPKRGELNYDERCDTGSCDGHGWVCTENGWICLPNVSRPPSTFDLNSCCPTVTMLDTQNNPYQSRILSGYYDEEAKKVACACPNTNNVTNGQCAPNTCCPDGNCLTDSFDKKVCCQSQDRVCSSSPFNQKCCGPDEKCVNGKCGTICGDNACNEGDICVKIENVDNETLNFFNTRKNLGDKITIKDRTVQFCKSPETCMSSDQITIPSPIDNYYPCRPFFGDTSGEIGYCKPINLSNTTLQSDIDNCKNKSKNDCNNNCEWRNILDYMSSANSTDDLRIKSNDVNLDMKLLTNNYGSYCTLPNESRIFSRVIGYNIDKSKCDWKKCFTNLAQPGVSKMTYNPDTGTCVGIKDCNSDRAKMQSYNNQTGQTLSTTLLKDKTLIFDSCRTANCPDMPVVGRNYICDIGDIKDIPNVFYTYSNSDYFSLSIDTTASVWKLNNITELNQARKHLYLLQKYFNDGNINSSLSIYDNFIKGPGIYKKFNSALFDINTNTVTFNVIDVTKPFKIDGISGKTLISSIILNNPIYKCNTQNYTCNLTIESGVDTYDNLTLCQQNCPSIPENFFVKYDNSTCYDYNTYLVYKRTDLSEFQAVQELYKISFNTSYNSLIYNKTINESMFIQIDDRKRVAKNNGTVLYTKNKNMINFNPVSQVIKSRLGNTARVMNVHNNNPNERIVLFDNIGAEYQKFTMDEKNRLVVYPGGQKRCVETVNNLLYSRDCNENNTQKWLIDENERLRPYSNTSSCIDVAGANNSNGTGLITYACNSDNNQKWFL